MPEFEKRVLMEGKMKLTMIMMMLMRSIFTNTIWISEALYYLGCKFTSTSYFLYVALLG